MSPTHSRSASPRNSAVLEEEEEEGADLPAGSNESSRFGGHTGHALEPITVTYLGSTFSPKASYSAAATAWEDVQVRVSLIVGGIARVSTCSCGVPARSHTRHISRRTALFSGPNATVFKPYARRQALFPALIKILLSVLRVTPLVVPFYMVIPHRRCCPMQTTHIHNDHLFHAHTSTHTLDVQSPDIAAFKQAAKFTMSSSGVVSVTTPAPSHTALFAAPAININMVCQIPDHPDTVAIFSKDPNLNFMVCHLVTADITSGPMIVDKLRRLIADTGDAVRRMSVSGPESASSGGRRASVRFAKKTAVVAGNGKRMYSIKRRTKDAKRTNKGLVSSPGGTPQVTSADLSKPIGIFKILHLGSIGTDKETGADVPAAAIKKFVAMQLEQGGSTAPTPGALAITLSGFNVVELASSEELCKVNIQNMSYASVVEVKSDLAPLKALGYKGWDRPLLVVIRNKSKLAGKRIPEAELIVLEKGAKPKEVLKLLIGASAAAATRHHNRQNAFDAEPNADSSEEVFLGGSLKEIERVSLVRCLQNLIMHPRVCVSVLSVLSCPQRSAHTALLIGDSVLHSVLIGACNLAGCLICGFRTASGCSARANTARCSWPSGENKVPRTRSRSNWPTHTSRSRRLGTS